jgi:hypothetical protein
MSFVSTSPYSPREKPDMEEYIDIILLTRRVLRTSGRYREEKLKFNDELKLDAWYV